MRSTWRRLAGIGALWCWLLWASVVSGAFVQMSSPYYDVLPVLYALWAVAVLCGAVLTVAVWKAEAPTKPAVLFALTPIVCAIAATGVADLLKNTA